MPFTSTILKYLKVKALADRGGHGERDNAARILSKMRADHPGIEEAAADYVNGEKREENGGNPAPSGVWPKADNSNTHRGFKFGGNWEELFNFAQGVVNGAYDFANTVANAYAGRLLAEQYVRSSTKSSRSGNILITLRMSLAAYNQAQRLNAAQKQAFRQAMHEILEDELSEMLGDYEHLDDY